MRRWNQDFEEVWGDQIRVHPDAYFDLGEQTLAFAMARGRGRHNHVETEMQLSQVATWRDGLMVSLKSHAMTSIVRFSSHTDRARALEAVGLSDQSI